MVQQTVILTHPTPARRDALFRLTRPAPARRDALFRLTRPAPAVGFHPPNPPITSQSMSRDAPFPERPTEEKLRWLQMNGVSPFCWRFSSSPF